MNQTGSSTTINQTGSSTTTINQTDSSTTTKKETTLIAFENQEFALTEQIKLAH